MTTVTLTVTVRMDEDRIKPNGPVDHLPDGTPDLEFMCRARVKGAFSWMPGIEDVEVELADIR